MAKVIVFSSITAGGKTTLIHQLSTMLDNSVVISFDDYNIDALPSAPSLDTPIEIAVNQYDIHQLVNDLLAAIAKKAFILVDFPFGNRYGSLSPYIDTTIYIKTPLDIAFSRIILRDFANKTQQEILEWSETYLTFARPIFVNHDNYVSETADLLLDGSLSVSDNIQKVLKFLES